MRSLHAKPFQPGAAAEPRGSFPRNGRSRVEPTGSGCGGTCEEIKGKGIIPIEVSSEWGRSRAAKRCPESGEERVLLAARWVPP